MRGVVLHPILLGVGLLLVSLSAVVTGRSGVALASLVVAGPVQEEESQDAQVSETLNTGLLTAKLVEIGLSEQEASRKVAQLDEERVAALVENLDRLEVGGGIPVLELIVSIGDPEQRVIVGAVPLLVAVLVAVAACD